MRSWTCSTLPGYTIEEFFSNLLVVKQTDYQRQLGTHPSIAMVGHPPTCNGLLVMAAQSVGQDVRMFPSIQEAIDWLNRSPVDLWR
jgi:hypothetical protein